VAATVRLDGEMAAVAALAVEEDVPAATRALHLRWHYRLLRRELVIPHLRAPE
jgi:hypothetical protein